MFAHPCSVLKISISIADVPHEVSGEIMTVKHMAIKLNGVLFLFWFFSQVLNRDYTAGDTSRDCLLLFSMYEHS